MELVKTEGEGAGVLEMCLEMMLAHASSVRPRGRGRGRGWKCLAGRAKAAEPQELPADL